MSGCNTVVWLNDEEARFSQFAAAGAPSQEIPARPFRVRRGQPSPHAAARHGQDSFYSDIAAALVAAEAILLVGPGEAKLALLRASAPSPSRPGEPGARPGDRRSRRRLPDAVRPAVFRPPEIAQTAAPAPRHAPG